jgi:predicted glycosyltransferase
MARNSTFNILMYSHDTYGLGHIRRTMAIASHLRAPRINILILTGSPIVGRFNFPEQIDFVRIPGMIKKTNDEYQPLSIKINPRHALDIRKNIITATAKTFQPHLFIVDKEPLGLKREVLPTLQWLRRSCPRSRTILGLRDVMDDRDTVRTDWRKKGIYDALDQLYTEIWVYGHQEMYDPIEAYAIPESVRPKIHFTGYIPRRVPTAEAVARVKKEATKVQGRKLVAVTGGGGGDAYPLMDAYLAMLEQTGAADRIDSVLIAGPFMPKSDRKRLVRRGRRLGVTVHRFFRRMEEMLAAADLVVGMAGYNTLCEILSQKTLSLLIPRETPRKEQLIRSQIFKQKGLADYIPWSQVSARSLQDKVFHLLENARHFREAIDNFPLTGLDRMQQRLKTFRQKKK